MNIISEQNGDAWFEIISEAADDIMQMSEEEYRGKLEQAGINLDEERAKAGKKAHQILEEIRQRRREKLQQEYKKSVSTYQGEEVNLPTAPEDRRDCLVAMMGSQFYGGRGLPLTAQFRNIAELSDADVEKILRSLKQLETHTQVLAASH